MTNPVTINLGQDVRRCRLALLITLLFPCAAVCDAQTAQAPLASAAPADATGQVGSGVSAGVEHEAAAALAAAAFLDADPRVREDAVRALGEGGDQMSLPMLEQALLDSDSNVRTAAIQSLSDLAGEGAASALAVALGDEDAELREEAVYALGKIGGTTAIGLLQFALGDPEQAVREAAAQILAELSGP